MRREKSPEIQPFLNIWDTDTEDEIRSRLQELKKMGISSFVIQYAARENDGQKNWGISPFDERYFSVLGKISNICREMQMTYWTQDAAPFPTGAANGAFRQEEYFQRGKLYIEERHTNVRGPLKSARIAADRFNGLLTGGMENIIAGMKKTGPEKNSRARLLGVTAMPETEENEYDAGKAINLTEYLNEESGILQFDLPAGIWRIFFIFETHIGNGRKFYMNLLDKESVKVQIEKVHELHYSRLKDELGITWEGFFYDEPEVGNVGGYDFNCLPGDVKGRTPAAMPWSRGMPEAMKNRLGEKWLELLPGLWYECGETSRIVRYHYMDAVTRAIQENYNGQVFSWCRDRGIRYIGHVVEDENSHTRLGCGTGHFFRTQRHQDMAGVDLIGGQLRPGMDMKGVCWYGCADGDGEFYHYGLCRLAASEAHINPEKQGGSFCEINAVYQELSNGKFYKFLLDHLFVNGIDHLVPVIRKALLPEEGAVLFHYAGKICRMLSGGKAVIPAAVLYHAEAEWSGSCMYFQKAGAVLQKEQIAYDVIPGDVFVEREYYHTMIMPGGFSVNGQEYRALIIPKCSYIREDVLKGVLELHENGTEIMFIDSLPVGYCERAGNIEWKNKNFSPVPLQKTAVRLKEKGIYDVRVIGSAPWLRYAHWKKEERDYYLFLNEDDRNGLQTKIIFPGSEHRYIRRVDAEENWIETTGAGMVDLSLGCLGSALYIIGEPLREEKEQNHVPEGTLSGRLPKIGWSRGKWTAEYEKEGTKQIRELAEPEDLEMQQDMIRFTGELVYRTKAVFIGLLPDFLNLGEVCDSAHVYINGIDAGYRIAAPYIFDVSSVVKEGSNAVEIHIQPSPARGIPDIRDQDMESIVSPCAYVCMPRLGLIGPVCWQKAAE